MAQLYFKFGAMGSSKTANALMARFNYEERGQETLLVLSLIHLRRCRRRGYFRSRHM